MLTESTSSASYVLPAGSEGGFFALCAAVCSRAGEAAMQSDAPLKDRLHLRSDIRPTFHADEFKAYFEKKEGKPSDLLTVQLSFLTLAGSDGVLPWWITEKMMWDRHGDGEALHAFLDILNRRFWELLFLTRCVGTHPHYGSYKQQHTDLLSNLSFAAVGMARDVNAHRTPKTDLVNRMQRYCWAAATGTGGVQALNQLLSDSTGLDISLQEHVPVHLEITERARLHLGHLQLGASTGQAIGSKAWVACGLIMTIGLIDKDNLDNCLPTKMGSTLLSLRQTLQTCYVQNMAPMEAYLRCAPGTEACNVGQQHMRLGWGAAIATRRAACQILKISRSAIDCQKQ